MMSRLMSAFILGNARQPGPSLLFLSIMGPRDRLGIRGAGRGWVGKKKEPRKGLLKYMEEMQLPPSVATAAAVAAAAAATVSAAAAASAAISTAAAAAIFFF